MDDVLTVDVLDPLAQGGHVVAGLRLCHCHSRLQDVNQRLPGAVLQHDVDVVPVLEVFEELYYILVTQRTVKLDFSRDFLFVMGLRDP